MDAQHGRRQTTLGVWLGYAGESEKRVLVLDVEGTDSRERGEDHGIFERKTSLLSLALSEILVINMWVHDVGRFEGANYGLLKIVLELNLQLFQMANRNKQLLLFIFRDHSQRPQDAPLQSFADTITSDLDKIWASISKPEAFVDSKVSDFFDFQFVSLPSIIYEEESFKNQVSQLRTRFLSSTSEDPFLTPEYKKDIPADGFAHYLEEIWKAIQENKDLNLPSQKEMLSVYRCDQISLEAFDQFKEQVLVPFEDERKEHQLLPNFSKRASEGIQAALSFYDTAATRYDNAIYESKRVSLLEKLNNKLYVYFKAQAEHLRKKTFDTFAKEVRNQVSDTAPTPDFLNVVKKVSEVAMNQYKEIIQSIQVSECTNWSTYEEEIQDLLNQKIEDLKEKQLDLMLEKSYIAFESLFDRRLRSLKESKFDIDTIKIWEDIREEFQSQRQHIMKTMEGALKTLEKVSDENTFEKRVHSEVLKKFMKVFNECVKDVSHIAEKMFDKNFNEGENGLPKKWMFVDVEKTYLLSKNGASRIFDIFSIIRLEDSLKNVSWFNVQENGSLTISDTLPDIGPQFVAISARDCERMLENFVDRSKSSYKLALHEKEKSSSNGYAIALAVIIFLIFGWDEMKTILTSPILLFFTAILGGCVAVLYKLDLLQLIPATLNMIISRILKQLTKEKED